MPLPARAHTYHAVALLSAAAAGFGALLAVLVGVFSAFGPAGFAHLGAEVTHLTGEFAVAGHVIGRQGTYLGAVHVQPDAAGHHFYVFFLQAGGGAAVTGNGAGQAGVNAALEF